jgi:putative ABC transport system substrate-binding protein
MTSQKIHPASAVTPDFRRRGLVRALIASSLAWALPAAGQQKKVYTVGVLGVASPTTYALQVQAFHEGLRELGYLEGQNLKLEYRWAEGNVARLPELAAELVRLNPDAIVTSGPGTAIAKRATGKIPIVMAVSINAVESGLVASLAHPGANITGSTSFGKQLAVKRLEVLRDCFPGLQRVGVLIHPENLANPGMLQAMRDAAQGWRLQIDAVEARGPADFENAFAALTKARTDALVVSDYTVFVAQAARIANLAAANRLPAIGFVEIAEFGGLLAYGVDFPHLWRRAAKFVDKILKGSKPADLPVEQPTTFEFVVNARAVRALGISLPRAVQARANRIIE